MLTGSCLCGDVAFEVHGEITQMMHCHCSMCSKFHGSAFATFGVADSEALKWLRGEDKLVRYKSSEQGGRDFCPRCGSAVPMPAREGPFALFPMGNVAEDPGTRPSLHFLRARRRHGTRSSTTWRSTSTGRPGGEVRSSSAMRGTR